MTDKPSIKRPMVFFVLVLLALSFHLNAEIAEGAAVQKPRVLSAWDTIRINRVSDPRISPDGKWVLYTMDQRDLKDSDLKSITHIWRINVDGTENRQLTHGQESCTFPRWFPCGNKIAFLASQKKTGKQDKDSKNEEKTQIFFMYTDGGESWQATHHKENIKYFEISPDGNLVLFIAQDSLSKEEEEKKKKKDDTEIVDEKFCMSHLWTYNIAENQTSRLTERDFTVSEAHWSPDGGRIVYVSRKTPKNDDRWTSDIWIIDLESKTPSLIYDNPGPDLSPSWSPDGKTIAFASNPYSGSTTMFNKLHLISADGSQARVLLKDFDRNFSFPTWSPDGQSIYWATGDRTTVNLFSVEIKSGKVKLLEPPRGGNFQWELSKDGSRWVWVHTSPGWPGEIYTADVNLKHTLCLTDANYWMRKEKIMLAEIEVVKWKNSDGQWIEGVLTKPVGYQKGKKYPMILNPHGGPSGAVTESFNSTNQFFAGNGFMILQPNFRGSSNYGQEFINANRNQWGIRDYDDCMTGVDFCVTEGWADPDRLGCYGWSYGGYLSFWIVTQTDRFKAVSPGAGLSNLYSMYSNNDIPSYLQWFLGTPWANEELYEKLSPIRHVKKVKSPVLIMHGANDQRVPPSQAEEFYRALLDLGKEVTYLRFPREGHGIREPRHHIDRLKKYLEFFCKHLGLSPVSEKTKK